MKATRITDNATLIRDEEGYWLLLTTSAGEGLYNLSKFADEGTKQSITFNEVLEAYFRDHEKPPPIGPQN